MGMGRETLTLPNYTLCGITYKSVAQKILPPGHILGGVDVPADVSVNPDPLERERAQHPTHPHAAHGAEGGHGLVDNATQRSRAIHAHEVLIERLRIAADRDAPLTLRPQRRLQESGQQAASTETTATRTSSSTPSARKPASIPASGPPLGGSSSVRMTPSGTRTVGGTTATHPAPHASTKTPHTRSIKRIPPSVRSGFETPPRRSPPPPPTTIAATSARGATGFTPTGRKSARRHAASPHPS